ncbi:MAG: hypothetical protein QM687_13455 [Ferruginibacter sp.]
MANRSTDILFQLIRSLQKSEKRNFKLYTKRNSGNQDLKMVELFDAIDNLDEYDETVLLKKVPSIKKQQLSNAKAHLYRQLLASLRVLKSTESIDMQLHEQLDYAKILYNKGLHLQSLKILERAKELAKSHNQDTLLMQVISMEKKIESLHITRSMQNRADELAEEALDVNIRRRMITRLSNLALKLYSWYVQHGHARDREDEKDIRKYFQENMPEGAYEKTGFYERMYLYQSYCWFAFIRQDFLMYYRYTQKWVDLFHDNPMMIEVETAHYIKGMHNLMNAHFDLRNYQQFAKTLKQFEAFSETPVANVHETHRIHTFVYLNSAKLNLEMIVGNFSAGLVIAPSIEEKLKEYSMFLDFHRILVFNYKIATLHFGAGNYEKSIDYLRRIINDQVDLRSDLQCYARLVHLLAHYELGNHDIIEHLTKSVYRFMAKMKNLTVIEEEVFKFLRKSFSVSRSELKTELEKFLANIKKYEKDRYATRAFSYLDLVSWVESKLYNKTMSQIIREKYLASNRRITYGTL